MTLLTKIKKKNLFFFFFLFFLFYRELEEIIPELSSNTPLYQLCSRVKSGSKQSKQFPPGMYVTEVIRTDHLIYDGFGYKIV